MNHIETLKEIEKLIAITHGAMSLYDYRSSNPIYGNDEGEDVHISLFNYILYQYEILIMIYEATKKDLQGRFDELKLYPDVRDRILYLQTTAFVKSVSSIEYVFKHWLSNDDRFGPNIKKCFSNKNQTFGKIVKAMKDDGFLSNDILTTLSNINYLRNCIVHNNSISQDDYNVKIGPVEIQCVKGVSIEFGVADLTMVTIKLIEVFEEFYCKVLNVEMIDHFPEWNLAFNNFLEDIYKGNTILNGFDKLFEK